MGYGECLERDVVPVDPAANYMVCMTYIYLQERYIQTTLDVL